MTGWKECEPLRRLWTETLDHLQTADLRGDVHGRLAEELTVFLAREVWPHLETPLH